MNRQINIVIEQKSALTVEGDVLALKYADAFYGVDEAVANQLMTKGIDPRRDMPRLGEFSLIDTHNAISAERALFVGVGYLYDFQYKEIRDFSRIVLSSLVEKDIEPRRLIVTLHGTGYGLDEVEAFKSEIAGFIDGITTGNYPKSLETIVFAERNFSRANRLQIALTELLPDRGIWIPGESNYDASGQTVSDHLQDVGYGSRNKAHVFVAMPFLEEMDDVYHYGIQGAVKAAGFLCERADLSSFTGDVMNWVKQRIDSATFVIADLTGANANVYLEVGYAWGRNKSTVLVVKDAKDLKFDLKGQKCIEYKTIKHLEDTLQQELEALKAQF